MARKCTICTHPDVALIDRELIEGVPRSQVARRHDLGRMAVNRHFEKHLLPRLASGEARVAAAAAGVVPAAAGLLPAPVADAAAAAVEEVSLAVAMRGAMAKLSRVVEACEDELRDPDDPEKYFFGPRAREIRIGYTWVDEEGKEQRSVATLQELLDLAFGGTGMMPAMVESRAADPRELLLKALRNAMQGVQMAVKVFESIDQSGGTVDLAQSEEWHTVMRVLIDELAPVPEIRARIVRRLGELAATVGRRAGVGAGSNDRLRGDRHEAGPVAGGVSQVSGTQDSPQL